MYESHYTGGIRFTFLGYALEMPANCTISRPMKLSPVMKWTGFSRWTTHDHTAELVADGQLKIHPVKGKKEQRYEMLKLAGPLFVVPEDTRQDGWKIPPSSPQHGWKNHPSSALISRSRGTSTNKLLPATDPPAAAVLKMHAFVEWCGKTFPDYHDGRPSGIDVTTDGQVVLDLFKRGEPLDLVQDQAIELWTMKADDNPRSDRSFCATSDHNVRVLRRKQRFLEGEIQRRADADRLQIANDVWTQVLRRIESQVSRHHFYTWLRQTTLVEDRGDTIDVEVLAEVIADWIVKHYRDVVGAALGDVERPSTRVQFVVNGEPYCSLDGFAAGADVANVVTA